jgi:hypothetical protein
MLPALIPTQTLSVSAGSRSASPGLAHPVAQVRRVAAVDQQQVGVPDPWHPALVPDGGQCGELEDAERLPAQAGQVPVVGLAGDKASHRCRAVHRVTPLCCGHAEGVALVDRLAQELHERRVDAGVRDAAGREKKLQDVSRNQCDGAICRRDTGPSRDSWLLTRPTYPPQSPTEQHRRISEPNSHRHERARTAACRVRSSRDSLPPSPRCVLAYAACVTEGADIVVAGGRIGGCLLRALETYAEALECMAVTLIGIGSLPSDQGRAQLGPWFAACSTPGRCEEL